MVAVKSVWVLWKSISSSFFRKNSTSTTSHCSSVTTIDQNRQSRYNRLKPVKSRSHPVDLSHQSKSSSSSISRNGNKNCDHGISKSTSSYDTNGNTMPPTTRNEIGWRYEFDSDSDYEDNGDEEDGELSTTRKTPESAEYDEDSSDFDDDDDEDLTCDVCDQAFPTVKMLADHQQRKRHFGCLQCDSLFPSRQALDHHREQMDHYDFVSDYCDDSDATSFDSDEEEDEEHDRLLLL